MRLAVYTDYVYRRTGGTVRAESVPGQGTLIHLSLPVVACPPELLAAMTATVAAEPR